MKNQTAKWITAAAVIVAAVSLIIGVLVYMDHQKTPTLVMKNRPVSYTHLGRELISGQQRSLSHFDTALSVTFIFSASSNWVMPCSFLREAIIIPRVWFFIIVPPHL